MTHASSVTLARTCAAKNSFRHNDSGGARTKNADAAAASVTGGSPTSYSLSPPSYAVDVLFFFFLGTSSSGVSSSSSSTGTFFFFFFTGSSSSSSTSAAAADFLFFGDGSATASPSVLYLAVPLFVASACLSYLPRAGLLTPFVIDRMPVSSKVARRFST